MTYEEAKNQVAQSYGWGTSKEFEENESLNSVINNLCKEAAELYAKSKWEEGCQAQKNWCRYMVTDELRHIRSKIDNSPEPKFKP